jgi:hypothetical protein
MKSITRQQLDRREFGREAALALLGGAVITVYGCGGGGGGSYASPTAPSAPTPTGSASSSSGSTASISSNHGHVAVITSAQLTTGDALRLDIRGSADHTHSVELSAAQVIEVRGGGRVAVGSTSTDAHTHAVVFNGQPDGNDSGYY